MEETERLLPFESGCIEPNRQRKQALSKRQTHKKFDLIIVVGCTWLYVLWLYLGCTWLYLGCTWLYLGCTWLYLGTWTASQARAFQSLDCEHSSQSSSQSIHSRLLESVTLKVIYVRCITANYFNPGKVASSKAPRQVDHNSSPF